MARFLRLLVLVVVIAYVVARFKPDFHRLLTTTTFIGAVTRPTEERSNAEPVPNLDMFNGCAMEGDASSLALRALDRLKNRKLRGDVTFLGAFSIVTNGQLTITL